MSNSIQIWSVRGFLAFIAHDEASPFTWSNQVNGTSCDHPSLRGVLIPLGGHPENDTLYEARRRIGDSVRMAARFLKVNRLADTFEPLAADEYVWNDGSDDLPPWFVSEAWVAVRVRENLKKSDLDTLLLPFVGRKGVITYCNSD